MDREAVSILLCSMAACLFSACGEGDRLIGGSCERKEDCSTGLCLQERRYGESTGWTGGYCTAVCADTCREGASCIPFEDQAYCMGACQSAGDCREGYLCDPWQLVCLPDCRNGWSCGSDFVCNADGFCAEPGAEYPVSYDAGAEDAAAEDGGAEDGSDGRQDAGEACGDCPDGYVCSTQSLGCVPDCRLGFSCPTGYSCNMRGLCVQGGGGPGGTQGP